MKRAIRWIGIGITAAAAATMLLADVVLAAPAGVGTRPFGATGSNDAYQLSFDVLSPKGLTCAVDAPGADVRNGRDLFGQPLIRIQGNARDAAITCTGPGGDRWQAVAQRDAPYTPSETTYGTVLYRPGAAATLTIVEVGNRTEYHPKSFVRLD